MRKISKIALKARVLMEKAVFNRIVIPLLSVSRVGHNTVTGRADAGLSIDYLYRYEPCGINSLGRFVDGVLLRLPAVKATRKKKDVIIKILQNEAANNVCLCAKTRILDIASGPARYLVDFFDKPSHVDDVEVLCIDSDQESVNLGKVIGREKPIRFVRGDVFKLGTLRRFSGRVGWKPNIILCTGFFELQNDFVVNRFLKDIYDFMETGGLLLFTSQADNPSKKLMKKAGKRTNGSPWKIYFRDSEKLRRWMIEVGFRDVIISQDFLGMYEYCTGRKVENV
jgi:hypothetical protein